jgi:hypothetical protein
MSIVLKCCLDFQLAREMTVTNDDAPRGNAMLVFRFPTNDAPLPAPASISTDSSPFLTTVVFHEHANDTNT